MKFGRLCDKIGMEESGRKYFLPVSSPLRVILADIFSHCLILYN